MNKNAFCKVALAKGEINVYDFGNIKLHAYKTNDLIDDEVFILEKGGKAVILEAPCFHDNIAELTEYLADNALEPAGLLLAYHMAGASFLPGVPVYATKMRMSMATAAAARRWSGTLPVRLAASSTAPSSP